jgi:hypothetical protein
VILTNADSGGYLLHPFMRRLMEILYDGKSEADGDVAAAAARHAAEVSKTRERLVIPPQAEGGALARRYRSTDLGQIVVRRDAKGLVFDFGSWSSHVASRKNDDGTTSFITIDPTSSDFEFVVDMRSGKRALITRDGQHEYVYIET